MARHLLTELSDVPPKIVVVMRQFLDALRQRDTTFQHSGYL